jgi:hypothetical protein
VEKKMRYSSQVAPGVHTKFKETVTPDGRDLSKEEWQMIPGFSRYEITPDGDVRNIRTGKLLTELENKTTGAFAYSLYKDDGMNTHRTYQSLVYLAYPELKPKPEPTPEPEKKPRRYARRGGWKDIPGFPQYQMHEDGIVRYKVSRRRREIHKDVDVEFVFLFDNEGKEYSKTIEELLELVFPKELDNAA